MLEKKNGVLIETSVCLLNKKVLNIIHVPIKIKILNILSKLKFLARYIGNKKKIRYSAI